VAPTGKQPAAETTPAKKKKPHRRSSSSGSGSKVLGPDHRPNPFD